MVVRVHCFTESHRMLPRRGPHACTAPLSLFAATLLAGALLVTGCLGDDDPPGEHRAPADAGADVALDAGDEPDLGSGGEDAAPDLAVEEDTGPGVCAEGETRCWEEKLATCLPDQSGWLVEACPEGQMCRDGECHIRECSVGETECVGDAVRTCSPDVLVWSNPIPCGEGESCVQGVCLPQTCAPGEHLCGRALLMTCAEDGLSWAEEDCPEGWVCFDGRCRECLRDADCLETLMCQEGDCVPRPLFVNVGELPAGMIDAPYEAALQAAGGTPPYAWTMTLGPLPAGVAFDADGLLAGTPTEAGEFPLTVQVQDAAGARAEAELLLRVHGQGLIIATERLPGAEEGIGYAAQLEALGGTAPYAWMIAEGALPAGLALGGDGRITGAPSEIGAFPLLVKVFDNSAPTQQAERELTLQVAIAPLEIVGDQEYDLWVFKVIVLPMITVVENIPIPYSTPLRARGGLRPYTWSEQDLPAMLRPLIPQAGIPDGIELAEDGTLQGAVTTTEQVVSLTIPFTQITLHGFFFLAEVADSQDPAETKQAVFLLPTLPLGGGGQ